MAGAAIVSASAYFALYWTSRELHPLPLAWFFGIISVPISAWIASWLYLRHRESTSGVLATCIAAAIVFRVIGFFGAPLYEDDFYRYLWDGYVFATRGSPYGIAPSRFFNAPDLPGRMDEILSQVNYPDIPTIYGPVCQLAFLAAYTVAPGALWPLKLVLIAADLGIALIIWRWTRSVAAFALYAWAPLVVKEVAFTAHPDVLAAFFATCALYQIRKERALAGASLLGAAVAAKVLALVLIPFVLGRRDWRAAITFAATICGLYAPFVLNGTSDAAGLLVFASEWEFNSFAYGLLRHAFGSDIARVLSPALFCLSAAALWRFRRDMFRPDIVLALLFLFAPVVNPWYLVLLAPFVALQPSWWGITALTTVFISYASGQNLGREGIGQFDHPWWVRPVEAVTVLLAAAYDLRRQHRND